MQISISVVVFFIPPLMMFFCKRKKLNGKYLIDKKLGEDNYVELLEVSRGKEKFRMKRIIRLERLYDEDIARFLRKEKNR